MRSIIFGLNWLRTTNTKWKNEIQKIKTTIKLHGKAFDEGFLFHFILKFFFCSQIFIFLLFECHQTYDGARCIEEMAASDDMKNRNEWRDVWKNTEPNLCQPVTDVGSSFLFLFSFYHWSSKRWKCETHSNTCRI